MIYLRDYKRYGIFKADSDEGIVKVKIVISGFGEEITIYKDKKEIACVDTIDDEEYYDENDSELTVDDVTVKKPFIRCLKRFK